MKTLPLTARELAMLKEFREIEQIAGQALGYPWFKDDQKNFPGTTEADGVCIGEHTAVTIVMELADKYKELCSTSTANGTKRN